MKLRKIFKTCYKENKKPNLPSKQYQAKMFLGHVCFSARNDHGHRHLKVGMPIHTTKHIRYFRMNPNKYARNF